jgi:hypothetical protein
MLMPDNTGILLLGLGALLFLGRGGIPTPDEDNRLVTTQGRRLPMPLPRPAFNLQSYIDGLFRDTASAPVQPPVQFFQPRDVVVTSSGVAGVVKTPPELITQTTKVAIGGDGGETITASALAVKRSEQITQQRLAKPAVEERPPTINFYVDDDEWTMNPFATAGQPITVDDSDDGDFIDVDFTPEYSESFEISGGMDSPAFAEDEQPSVEAVHEITAAYDIGF